MDEGKKLVTGDPTQCDRRFYGKLWIENIMHLLFEYGERKDSVESALMHSSSSLPKKSRDFIG